MDINFFCPIWGMWPGSIKEIMRKIREAGYDGIEFGFPLDSDIKEEFLNYKNEYSLAIVGQQYAAEGVSFSDYKKDFIANLKYLVSFNPTLINSHTGKDYFSFEQNAALIHEAFAIEQDSGIPIMHETHRGRFPYCVTVGAAFAEKYPDIKYTADFSHFCAVSESFLTDQTEDLKKVINRSFHIHARVGHTQGPQIIDPRLHEWAVAVNHHLNWWDAIVENHRITGKQSLSITPEFGPHPYMQSIPGTNMPIADQWGINLYMMNLLKSRYLN